MGILSLVGLEFLSTESYGPCQIRVVHGVILKDIGRMPLAQLPRKWNGADRWIGALRHADIETQQRRRRADQTNLNIDESSPIYRFLLTHLICALALVFILVPESHAEHSPPPVMVAGVRDLGKGIAEYKNRQERLERELEAHRDVATGLPFSVEERDRRSSGETLGSRKFGSTQIRVKKSGDVKRLAKLYWKNGGLARLAIEVQEFRSLGRWFFPGLVAELSGVSFDFRARNVGLPLTQFVFEQKGWIEKGMASLQCSCASPSFEQQTDRVQPIFNLDLYRTQPVGRAALKLTGDPVNGGYFGLKFDRPKRAGHSKDWLAPYVGIQGGSASMSFRSNSDTTFLGVSLKENSQRQFNRDTVGGLIGAYLRPWDGMSADIGTAFIDSDVAVEAKIKYAF